jgi:hypothetical protein
MNGDDYVDGASTRPAGHRKPSTEICYRLADNLRRYRN